MTRICFEQKQAIEINKNLKNIPKQQLYNAMHAGKKRKKRKSMSDSKDDEESIIDNIDNKRQKTDIKKFFVPVS